MEFRKCSVFKNNRVKENNKDKFKVKSIILKKNFYVFDSAVSKFARLPPGLDWSRRVLQDSELQEPYSILYQVGSGFNIRNPTLNPLSGRFRVQYQEPYSGLNQVGSEFNIRNPTSSLIRYGSGFNIMNPTISSIG